MFEDQREALHQMYQDEKAVFLNLPEAEHAARIIILAKEHQGMPIPNKGMTMSNSLRPLHYIQPNLNAALRAMVERLETYGDAPQPELVKIRNVLRTLPDTAFEDSLFGLKVADFPLVTDTLKVLQVPAFTPATTARTGAPAPQYKNPFRIS